MRYSVLIGWRMMILLMSLNSFQSSSLQNFINTKSDLRQILTFQRKYSRYSLSVFVFHKRLELGTARDGEVESLCSEEGLEVEQVKVVLVDEVGDELVGETVQCRHLWQ